MGKPLWWLSVEKLAEYRDALKKRKDAYDWAGQTEIQRRAAAAWIAHADGRKEGLRAAPPVRVLHPVGRPILENLSTHKNSSHAQLPRRASEGPLHFTPTYSSHTLSVTSLDDRRDIFAWQVAFPDTVA